MLSPPKSLSIFTMIPKWYRKSIDPRPSMKILYLRVSAAHQKMERQRKTDKNYDLVVEDECSGGVTFAKRPGGSKILGLVAENQVSSLAVAHVDRLGRNLPDILTTLRVFQQKKVTVFFLELAMSTILKKGRENPITTPLMSILGVIAQMQRNHALERQQQGIEVARQKGAYRGRKAGSAESLEAWKSKRNGKALQVHQMLENGATWVMIASTLNCSPSFISKVKRTMQNTSARK